MRASACPFNSKKCGNLQSPYVTLSEGSPQRVEMKKLSNFNENDVCHFTVTTDN